MADDFLNRAYQFFLSHNYAPHQAAALAANAQAESGGDTRAVHDSGTGLGIFGWRDPDGKPDRRTALRVFAQKRGETDPSEATQLEFALQELNTTEAKSGQALKAAKDYREAQHAVLGYLRPKFFDASNPTVPADRWNPGAGLAGEQPIMGPAMAAAGSATTPVVNPTAAAPASGLLMPSSPSAVDPAAAEAAAMAEQDKAMADLTQQGLGLLGKATTAAPAFEGDFPSIYRPDRSKAPQMPNYRKTAQPDFMKVLAQMKLQRRT